MVGRKRTAWAVGLAIALLCFARRASANTWRDPTFPEMIQESELIVDAEVVEGGAFFARVRAVQVLKGPPVEGDFVVGGFNDAWWSIESIKSKALQAGEHYLLFLTISRGRCSFGSHIRTVTFTKYDCDIPKAWEDLPLYVVPSPTMGEYFIAHGKIASARMDTSRRRDATGVSTDVVFPLVRAQANGGNLDDVANGRRILRKRLTQELVARVAARDEPSSELYELDWLLGAQEAFGDPANVAPVLDAITSPVPSVRLVAARALKNLDPRFEVLKVVEKLVSNDHDRIASSLQVEAVHALRAFDSVGKYAVPIIVAALTRSKTDDTVVDVMQPNRIETTSGREAMVRALIDYHADDAKGALVSLISRADNGPGEIEALLEYFEVHHSADARVEFFRVFAEVNHREWESFYRYFLADGDSATLDRLFEKVITDGELFWVRELFELYALHSRRGDRRLTTGLLRVLREHRDDQELAGFLPLSLAVTSGEVDTEIQTINPLSIFPNGIERLRLLTVARRLQDNPPRDAERRVMTWVSFAQMTRELFGDDVVLRELVCSISPSYRSRFKEKMQKTPQNSLTADILDMIDSEAAPTRPRTRRAFTCP